MENVSLSVLSFYLIAGLAVAGACGVAFSRNIIYSALSLMACFLGVSGLYVLLSAEFVAGIQVLVYVGGVLVITLFAVMLTQSIADMEVSNRSVAAPVGLVLSIGLFMVLLRVFKEAMWYSEEISELPVSTYAIGNAFLGTYVLPFELASIVLLTVLVGAVVLSRKEVREETEPQ